MRFGSFTLCLTMLASPWVAFSQAEPKPDVASRGAVVPPQARIARFAGDRAAAISYTFDDGLRDHYTLAAPLLNEVGFKGTFFVIPGKVSPTVEDAMRRQNDQRAWGTITWDELRQMSAQGHEIASHTWSHPNLTKLTSQEVDAEFSQAYNAIKKEIGRPPLTLAYPFNARTPEIETNALKYHLACRNFQTGVGGERTTVAWFNAWADQLVNDRQWGVVMAHGISNGYAAFTDPEILRSHLRHVKGRETNIWVDTFAKVSRYVKECEETKLSIAFTGSGQAALSLDSSLDPAVYDVPLTLVLTLPGVTSARAERAGRELPVRLFNDSIQIDAIPGNVPIRVTWQ